jgi:uncharacterized membrane protein
MTKLRPWTILIIFATMMVVAYIAVFRAAKQAQIREVPLAKTPGHP